MNFGEKLRNYLAAAKTAAPAGTWNGDAWVKAVDTFYNGTQKAAKRAGIDPRAKDVFNAYPRRSGGEAALVSISKAIAQDGLETVLEGTLEYAAAVARWPASRQRSPSGASLVPMPTTFYHQRRYCLDDRKTWWEGTGKKQKEEREAILLAEPSGWRFSHPESRFVTEHIAWAAIDIASQKWIIANTPPMQNRAQA